MAGQSEKKRLKKASAFIVYASPFFTIFSLIYIIFAFYFRYNLITRNIFLLHCLLFFCYYYSIKNIHYGLTNGLNFTYYTDVLILSFVINLGLFYSFKFFYIYIVIPIYAIFKTLNFIFTNFLSSPLGAVDSSGKEDKAEKKKNKVVYKRVY
ncbi:conserved protein, unknown function [Plasmodium vivax]|uniref:SND2 domain-containing protein n=5 Tax=Plasmodium vivax TaxID=5855 RepID=A5JZU0_PLAVS|nr:hypothetical protein, conserved [Plasmodium vivax]KMZ78051.1 hypothetical protein PVIIG_00738 [Plasmodium vivax India VII]KMZ90171.1 hypothetical protein PVMG_01538 [Plasmodium vivax Mauritania I]KMZ96881.1 hypothetical protein PVNG_01705 [Plasmodium vivax North Korean]EDL47501.1 hypothetical protein, conserved [Plasmodium vivax]CAG9472197.1 unnamed protein product [Plasmodium vivax]|eukprot:XP_001617228.1 hypothetical protein [Plasmodium vivax Sal-1]